jgi:Plasmid pRiA4b ORF-3-like protein
VAPPHRAGKILPAEPRLEFPACTGGRRASPPEDSGGVWGYKRFLEALADPDHPDHEMYSEWIGGTSFESEAFDPDEINAMFREIW